MDNERQRMTEVPAFKDFYRAVNDRAPFPWQDRLAQRIHERGVWPSEIGVPTGLGKTACLDIAVWWLASQAHLPAASRSAPTRIWWVVNRRLLVDEASKHAKRLKQILSHPGSEQRTPTAQETLRMVATRLRSVSGSPEGDPLHVIPMRGGITLKRPPNPAQPSVVVATIPMYGSRLLFRGYGSSRSMRPIDAALAGTDSLVLVDEAHLARHLRDLIPKLRQCIPDSAVDLLPAGRSAPQVVSLTATGNTSDRDRFELKDDDLANETVRRRLDAAKPMRIDADQKGAVAKALREAAVRLLSEADGPASCVVFCNTPAVAREAFELIAATKEGASSDCRLVTGRTRQVEADDLRDGLLSSTEGVPATDGRLPIRERHLVVVATQTLEVGADLDFEYLVSEQCGVRALTQRLGRLNRLGNHCHARAVYVHRPPPKTSRRASADDAPDSRTPLGGWPVYGSEPDKLLNHLNEQGHEDEVDLSPRVVADRLGEPEDDPGRAPEVLPGLLWEWVKTTTPPHGEAPVEPYFSGMAEQSRTVAVLWRAYVPEMEPENEAAHDDPTESETTGDRQHLWPRVSQDEIVEVPIWELQQALGTHRVERVVRRRRDSSHLEHARRGDLQPGDLVILPTDEGMHDKFGWAPDDRSPVTDVSVKRSGLPLDEAALRRLCGGHAEDTSTEIRAALQEILGHEDEVPDDVLARGAAERLITVLRDSEADGFTREAWNEFLDALDPSPARPPSEVPRLSVRRGSQTASLDESDEVSLCETLGLEAMQLEAHGKAVSEHARRLGTALGLLPPLVDLIAQAGNLHDIGKSDERFQRSLNPILDVTQGYTPMAKSNMPRSRWQTARADAGWPKGGRHEELSARLVKMWLAARPHGLDGSEQDLLVHLVVSHHGNGRPLVVPVADGTADMVRWTFADGTRAHATSDLSQTDWHQPARFHRLNDQFGPWGLALLEALVRQADHEMSRATEVQ